MRRFLFLLLALVVTFSGFADPDTPDKKPKVPFTNVYQPAKPDEMPKLPHVQRNVYIYGRPNPNESVKEIVQTGRPNGGFGIDVSHYQGYIDWKQVAQDSRVEFVYIKATESSGLVDGTYRRNIEGAREVGIPVGVYHFFSPSSPVDLQINNFFSNVDPKEQDLVPILDVEAPPKSISAKEYVARLRTFINAIKERFGCKPIIYTGPHFHTKYLLGNFTDCRFMFARYNQDPPVPAENVHFILWQFTASGSIKGIHGNVDRSQFMEPFRLKDIRYKR